MGNYKASTRFRFDEGVIVYKTDYDLPPPIGRWQKAEFIHRNVLAHPRAPIWPFGERDMSENWCCYYPDGDGGDENGESKLNVIIVFQYRGTCPASRYRRNWPRWWPEKAAKDYDVKPASYYGQGQPGKSKRRELLGTTYDNWALAGSGRAFAKKEGCELEFVGRGSKKYPGWGSTGKAIADIREKVKKDKKLSKLPMVDSLYFAGHSAVSGIWVPGRREDYQFKAGSDYLEFAGDFKSQLSMKPTPAPITLFVCYAASTKVPGEGFSSVARTLSEYVTPHPVIGFTGPSLYNERWPYNEKTKKEYAGKEPPEEDPENPDDTLDRSSEALASHDPFTGTGTKVVFKGGNLVKQTAKKSQ